MSTTGQRIIMSKTSDQNDMVSCFCFAFGSHFGSLWIDTIVLSRLVSIETSMQGIPFFSFLHFPSLLWDGFDLNLSFNLAILFLTCKVKLHSHTLSSKSTSTATLSVDLFSRSFGDQTHTNTDQSNEQNLIEEFEVFFFLLVRICLILADFPFIFYSKQKSKKTVWASIASPKKAFQIVFHPRSTSYDEFQELVASRSNEPHLSPSIAFPTQGSTNQQTFLLLIRCPTTTEFNQQLAWGRTWLVERRLQQQRFRNICSTLRQVKMLQLQGAGTKRTHQEHQPKRTASSSLIQILQNDTFLCEYPTLTPITNTPLLPFFAHCNPERDCECSV
ncbi:hypothetical protein VP01_1689g1 [Puccinia sorghi]|uniref:Uncharacterized protein n=1 Tax=Puccinia sorghi TaxID=27349 RepID=A0A0L6VFS5_9BASI|nr:hypothetical protein VP01_1689g1 [Puccinia sorghi]